MVLSDYATTTHIQQQHQKHCKNNYYAKAFGNINTTAIDQQKGFVLHKEDREAPYHAKQCHDFFTASRTTRFTFWMTPKVHWTVGWTLLLCVLPRRELLVDTLNANCYKFGQETSSYWYQQVVDHMIFYQRYAYFTCLLLWVKWSVPALAACVHILVTRSKDLQKSCWSIQKKPF